MSLPTMLYIPTPVRPGSMRALGGQYDRAAEQLAPRPTSVTRLSIRKNSASFAKPVGKRRLTATKVLPEEATVAWIGMASIEDDAAADQRRRPPTASHVWVRAPIARRWSMHQSPTFAEQPPKNRKRWSLPNTSSIGQLGPIDGVAVVAPGPFPGAGRSPTSPTSAISVKQCPVCKKTFTRGYNLKLHMHLHNGSKPFKCEQCPKTFVTDWMRTCHFRTHTGQRPFACGNAHCTATFTVKSSLKRHLNDCGSKRRRTLEVIEQHLNQITAVN